MYVYIYIYIYVYIHIYIVYTYIRRSQAKPKPRYVPPHKRREMAGLEVGEGKAAGRRATSGCLYTRLKRAVNHNSKLT